MLAAGGYSDTTASCQARETLVGGGALYNWSPPAEPTLAASGPKSDQANAWVAVFRNTGVGGSVSALAYALCAAP